ncbi:SDR family NAD(P)-dependent oxidoreductase [Streptomyces sp. ISL-98]|uniref:SDR family NAD(P)-dependent oxidoreductase n=1 Tax=Streptomyces sp. ISL-98 TaxID=2819192 RepID=UPI0027E439BD|nr:SDR family NAD(P)-dependent oxidoreductase [Streptomyces sp. ISL-98]
MISQPARSFRRDLVVVVSPFEEPNPGMVAAAQRAGALGLLDLGRDPDRARTALAALRGRGPYGVRVPAGCPLTPDELPDAVDTVLLAEESWRTGTGEWAADGRRRLWAEVVSPAEAVAAVAAGAAGLVARGHEAGGRVGELTTFVLLQRLLADRELDVPVFAAGGIGLHTAAAAVAGGAAGVVLDAQLALTAEGAAELPAAVASAIRAMDGSETTVVAGHRVYTRPDLALPEGDIARLLGARGLTTQPLPIGQDGATAARLAARHRTTGSVVQAVRAAITGHIEAAVRVRPLLPRPGEEHLPVVQGPMTRVSDRPAFAAAVADAEGLPFLALAVMDGRDVRRLLTQTAERLAGRPWGVGLLGFAPDELRREQLAAVAEARPPYAIIAGGRPAQAAPLEAAGTRTYLHVPSPGLLDQFLAEGARRFVFEGLECGGHIGPRAAFPLWEEQIERLLSCPYAAELDVLFAGGIHDERSAAMAAAAAGPLAERGARIGVLMGTAYLFTEEAVAAGAVLPGFQSTALDCDTTTLLRTAPGHATRCATTPYTDAFTTTAERLRQDGASPNEVWEELERLNLGRLRIASKGLRHTATGPVPVDEYEQREEGLYMLGQIATARTATTSVAALHAQVTEGATDLLAERAEQLREPGPDADREAPLDIAVVGMACRYPGADDLAGYWANIVAGTDSVTEVPADRWDAAAHHDPDPARAGERTPSRWGGFLAPAPFDALAHGIAPASLGSIEPVQLLALDIAARALADAGYAGERRFDRSRTSVVFGAEAGTDLAGAYGFRALHPGYLGELPPELDAQLPRLTEDSFPGVLANVIAGRVANRLDLGGANCTIDAACASSLAALDLACKQLRDRDSDMTLCGGADVHNGINDYLMFASVRALSPTGKCRPFDAAADGIALGEGVACVVLKRLADAERDGDRIYAVVKAVGASSDGRSLGLTAPRPEGQRRALERAYRRAGITPGEIGLVEAHGTGTVVGDSTELAVLTEAFGGRGGRVGEDVASCSLGSVKSQLGHTKCAAGLAGLIKAVRAVYSGVRPPTLHLNSPNPDWQPDSSPFFFDTEARPWSSPAGRRVAAVSAFGFGGTNYHAVLASYGDAGEPAHGLESWPAELFCFRGADRAAARRAMDRLAARLEHNDAAGRPWPLRDLAAEASVSVSASASAGDGEVQVAIVATGLDDLAAKLGPARDFVAADGVHVRDETTPPGQVAFLFPGQGSQRPGMLSDLFVAFPRLRTLLDGADPRRVAAMFPPAAFTAGERAAQRAAVTDTRTAQPALGLAGAAAHLLLTSLGVRPDCTAGHSYGELVALWAAGAYDTATLLRLSDRRADAILAAAGDDPGAMAAVSAAPHELPGLPTGCVVANHNAPAQTVISGPTPAVDAAIAALRDAGITAERIPVACAFHSEVVAGASEALADELADEVVAGPTIPVWSNTTAGRYPADPAAVRDMLARQLAEPVRFAEQIEAMYASGVRTFVEAGPGRVLTGLVGRTLGDRPHTAVPLDVPGEHGLTRLVTALAELAAAGVPFDPEPLFKGRTAQLPAEAPRRAGWLVDGHLVRTADGEPVAGGLRPARRVAAPGPVAAVDRREDAVLEYLRGARELVAAQRDVLLGYLGAEAAPSSATMPPSVREQYTPEVLAPRATDEEPEAPRALTPDQLMDAILEIVHTRTGYPREMLDPALDLEADLSVDSIKRVEIIGALADRIGLPRGADGPAESAVEELARLKTISGMVDWLTSRATPPAPAVTHPADSPAAMASDPVAGSATGLGAGFGTDLAVGSGTGPASARASDPAAGLGMALAAGSGTGPASGRDAGFGMGPAVGSATGAASGPASGLDAGFGTGSGLSSGTSSDAGPAAVPALGPASGLAAGLGTGAVSEPAAGPARAPAPVPASGTVPGSGPASGPASGTGPSTEPRTHRPLAGVAMGHLDTDDGAPQGAFARGGVLRPASRAARLLVEVAPVGPPVSREPADVLPGRRFAVVDDGLGVGVALAAALESYGAEVRTVRRERLADAAGADGVVDLGALRAAEAPVLPEAFGALREMLIAGTRRMLLVTGCGGAFGRTASSPHSADPVPGAGLYGFARTAAIEYPGVAVRAVDVDPKDRPERIAAHLIAELCSPEEPVAVGYTNGTRNSLRTVTAPLPDTEPPPPLRLGRDAVVLLTGGARGITARTAVALAHATGCHIELIGRTPPPDEAEDPAVAHAHDRVTLRAALVRQGLRTPAEVEAAASRVLAAREIRSTLAALGGVAASVRYHAVDVTDADAVRAVIQDVRARHGRLDGIVHGAGTIQDRLLCDKDPASFARVFATKVDGARHLADAAADHGDVPAPGFLVFFGSVAGVFGNRGQADYAAANDALDTLAATPAWSRRFPGRVLAIDWGPWAAEAGGMVTPELERMYASRGVPLLDPAAGTAAFLAELAHGTEGQVVLMAEHPGEARHG